MEDDLWQELVLLLVFFSLLTAPRTIPIKCKKKRLECSFFFFFFFVVAYINLTLIPNVYNYKAHVYTGHKCNQTRHNANNLHWMHTIVWLIKHSEPYSSMTDTPTYQTS